MGTGEKELFMQIWKERKRNCEECGAFLGVLAAPHFFSHYLSKGSAPALRLDKDNIDLLCFKHHFQWDNGDKRSMKIYNEERISSLKRKEIKASKSIFRI